MNREEDSEKVVDTLKKLIHNNRGILINGKNTYSNILMIVKFKRKILT